MLLARVARCLPVVAVLALSPSLAQAETFWTGDFETGDLKQWSYLLNEAGLSVVDMPVAQGKHAGCIKITKDNLWSNGLNRVELQYAPPSSHNTAGTEIYFGYSIYVPELLTTDSHQIGYWETTSSYQQLFHVAAMGSRVALRTQKPSYKEQWAQDGLLTPGQWHRLVWHIAWNASAGSIDLWWDGVQRVTALKVPTYLDNPPFTQLGILRDTIDKVETMYIDDALAGTSYEDVKGTLPAGAGGSGGAGGSAAAAGAAGTGATAGAGGADPAAAGAASTGGTTTTTPSAGGTGDAAAPSGGSTTSASGSANAGSTQGGVSSASGGSDAVVAGHAGSTGAAQPSSSCHLRPTQQEGSGAWWMLALLAVASSRRYRSR